MIKAPKKLGIEGMCLNIIKAICDKLTANIIETIFSKVRNKTSLSTLPTLIQYNAGIPSQSSNAFTWGKKSNYPYL
jgi:hypothetical protein